MVHLISAECASFSTRKHDSCLSHISWKKKKMQTCWPYTDAVDDDDVMWCESNGTTRRIILPYFFYSNHSDASSWLFLEPLQCRWTTYTTKKTHWTLYENFLFFVLFFVFTIFRPVYPGQHKQNKWKLRKKHGDKKYTRVCDTEKEQAQTCYTQSHNILKR